MTGAATIRDVAADSGLSVGTASKALNWRGRAARRGGLTLLPYFDGERSPNRPGATGVLNGITGTSLTRENMARAAVEAVLCSLADGIDNLGACGITRERVVLIGGAARSAAVRSIAPAVFGVPVTVPDPAEYVAIGAARGRLRRPAAPNPPLAHGAALHRRSAHIHRRHAAG